MKLFQEMELLAAYRYAKMGHQALHLFSDPGIYPGAPRVFKRSREAAHLFDQNKSRLVRTARRLGVNVIKIGREGIDKQHIDLCGQPLKRAKMRAEE